MHTFRYPAMPMYSQDHAAYCQQMYDWHMKMTQYHEQKKAYHMERAKYFQQMIRRIKYGDHADDPHDGAA